MNTFTLIEPIPTFTLVGGGAFTLTEPIPVIAGTGTGGGILTLVEPLPVLVFRGRSGKFAIVEPLPTLDFSGVWLSTGSFALTEPLPVFAARGGKSSRFTIVEPLPKLKLKSRQSGIITLEEPLPVFTLIGTDASTVTFTLVEPIPIFELVGYLTPVDDIAVPDEPEEDEQRALADYTAWSVNAKNNAHAGFTNYQFNAMIFFNGKYYGLRDDGLFELVGDDDAGTAIVTSNKWGPTDHGNAYPMRFHHANVVSRPRNGGTMQLKMTSEEKTTHTFALDPSATGKTGLHNDVVRGRRDCHGTELQPELVNVSGGDFEVNSLEIVVQKQPRRK